MLVERKKNQRWLSFVALIQESAPPTLHVKRATKLACGLHDIFAKPTHL